MIRICAQGSRKNQNSKARVVFKLRFLATSGTTFRAAAIAYVVGVVAPRVRPVPEPFNPHDRRAVRVEIAGQHVGYVPRGTCVKASLAPRCASSKWGWTPSRTSGSARWSLRASRSRRAAGEMYNAA